MHLCLCAHMYVSKGLRINDCVFGCRAREDYVWIRGTGVPTQTYVRAQCTPLCTSVYVSAPCSVGECRRERIQRRGRTSVDLISCKGRGF